MTDKHTDAVEVPPADRNAVLEEAANALHPAWFATDYNYREAQKAIRALRTPEAPTQEGE